MPQGDLLYAPRGYDRVLGQEPGRRLVELHRAGDRHPCQGQRGEGLRHRADLEERVGARCPAIGPSGGSRRRVCDLSVGYDGDGDADLPSGKPLRGRQGERVEVLNFVHVRILRA
ncbi:hypothetical protein GCM10010347_52180 [Streptomyces cirratus]|uniref:Uncharacterized protein n=1 Tax=Streptomyces cirratus TaxID=68187 RepID=A0ABQ3F373_9ACTN|nr:hypothetical protein GCM10010347_52180 [Streptomyces cirratus]